MQLLNIFNHCMFKPNTESGIQCEQGSNVNTYELRKMG